MSSTSTEELATRLRIKTLEMSAASRSSHVGSCLSVADIIAVLFNDILRFRPNQPDWPERDRFIMSKGHAAAVIYAALAEAGYIPNEALDSYHAEGSQLLGHVSHDVPGVEVSTGSLGHGLAIGAGMALFAKRNNFPWRTFVVVGDGELNEGSNWETLLFAAQHQLDNLICIVDFNKIQGFGNSDEVLSLNPLADKWRAFGWSVHESDGHDVAGLEECLSSLPDHLDKPSVIVADTVKGKGVSFMENQLLWHYRPPSDDDLAKAIAELEADR